MNGMELCEAFYRECAAPVLGAAFPELRYSAGLVGFGSDVLGYDDEVSRDHLWGPRLYVFPEASTPEWKDAIHAALVAGLPRAFRGFPVGYGPMDEHGICALSEGEDVFRPLVWIMPFEEFLTDQIGRPDARDIAPAEWLAFSEHKLLSLTKGRLFRDDLNLAESLEPLRCYPRDVWLYLLYSDWSAIAEEKAFVKRAAARGDDLGSRVVCARIVHRLMHLCFLYERRYAPYGKWFGTAFRELSAYPAVEPMLARALNAPDLVERELAVARAQGILIELHNERALTAKIDPAIRPYFTRDIRVAAPDAVAEALHSEIGDARLAALPPIGSLSSVGNLTALCEHTANRERLIKLYE